MISVFSYFFIANLLFLPFRSVVPPFLCPVSRSSWVLFEILLEIFIPLPSFLRLLAFFLSLFAFRFPHFRFASSFLWDIPISNSPSVLSFVRE